MKINAVDLFCGIGGLTYGIQQAGINVVAGYDIDEKSKFAYEYNNDAKFIFKDVREIEDNEILGLYPPDTDIKVLIGCAPCQPFSTYSHKYRNNENTIQKMDLLDYFGKQVKLVKPDIVSMENVPQLAKETVFKNFLVLLETEGYKVNWKIAFAPAYGIPQNRKRLLLLASKFGEISFIEELGTRDYPTVRQAIEDLPKLNAGETDPLDLLHTARNLSDINLTRIRSSKPGGTWRDWDDSLLPECFKKESGATYGSVYGRLEWDKPSSTITTQFPGYGNGRFGHPEQDRALSLREGAILQSFPRTYQFINDVDSFSTQRIAMQIGNAVPPKLGEVIGVSIKKHLEVYYEKAT